MRLTGTDLDDSIKYNTQMEKAVLADFPDEVEHVWSRIGTAEIATDPMGIELTDMFITLKPRNQWKKAHTQAELTELIEAAFARSARPAAGVSAADRNADERNGDRRAQRRGGEAVRRRSRTCSSAKGKEIEAILNQIPGTADVATEQITGQPVLQIKLNQQQLARHGVPAKVVTDIIESIGSKPLGEVIEGQLRFPLVVRLPEADARAASSGIGSILIPTAVRRAVAAVAPGRYSHRGGPVDDYARMGPAANHRLGQRPRPRYRQLCGRGPTAKLKADFQLAAGALLRTNSAGSSSICNGRARGC